jgi:archaeosine-15-forming tRNA-guanine transglycosylase
MGRSPQKTMGSIHRAIKPKGQVVLIDFHRIKGVSSDWVMNHVRAGQEVFAKEVIDAGVQANRREEGLRAERRYATCFLNF